MDSSSLNVDVLLYLMKFLDPVARFNVVLSGVLKGFENANEGIDLRKRIKGFGIELDLCHDGTPQLEIRSLEDRCSLFEREHGSCLITLERLAEGGYLKNNRQMIVTNYCPPPYIPWLFRVLRSMTDLETLSLSELKLTLTQDVPQLFRSCPKLTELRIKLLESPNLKMNEELEYELRSGFQRLQIFELRWDIDSGPVSREVLTWLKECTQLTLRNAYYYERLVIDGSVTLNPDLSQNLRVLHLWRFPVEFVKWILPFCSNIDTLKIHLIEHPNDLHNEIVRLKKLKDLQIGTRYPKEIIRNCRQVEILRVDASDITLRDLAILEHYENLKEAHLRWLDGPSVKKALQILKRCTNLHRLTLGSTSAKWIKLFLPPSTKLCEFIMELKNLTFLHIIYHDVSDCDNVQSRVDEVKAFVSLCRPNFKFYVSCCSTFHESRVPKEFEF